MTQVSTFKLLTLILRVFAMFKRLQCRHTVNSHCFEPVLCAGVLLWHWGCGFSGASCLMLFSTVKSGFLFFQTFAGAGLSSAVLVQGTITFGVQRLQKLLIHYVKTYLLISGYFAVAPFIISILGKMSIDDDVIFNSTKLITFLCITTLVYYLYRTGAVSTKSSTASPQQWEVWLTIGRRRHQQMVCRSCFFGGLVCTEQLWGPC